MLPLSDSPWLKNPGKMWYAQCRLGPVGPPWEELYPHDTGRNQFLLVAAFRVRVTVRGLAAQRS